MIKARRNNVKDILYEVSNQVEDIMHHNDTCFQDFEEANASNGSESQPPDRSDSVTDSDTDDTEEAVNKHVKTSPF